MIAVTHAVSHGLRISYMTALGDITANLLQMLIALAGVFYLSSQFGKYMTWVMWAGVAYLWYLVIVKCIALYKSRTGDANASFLNIRSEEKYVVSPSALKIQCFKEGFFVAALNPKAIILFGAILPQFILRESSHHLASPIYVSTMLAMDYIAVMVYAYLASRMASRLENPFVLNLISCVLLLFIVVRITLRNLEWTL